MSRWQDIRQLARIIEAEAEGLTFDRDQALALARRLAENHPHIRGSMDLVVRRLHGEARSQR
ncbi:MAG: hypothetical protein ACM3Q1_14240 [Bacteroidales bacterium]